MFLYRTAFIASLAALSFGCSKYDAPPQPRLLTIEDNLLPDPTLPIDLAFHEKFVFETLKVKIVRYDDGALDAEGNLLPSAEVYFSHTSIDEADIGGTGRYDDELGAVFTMTLNQTLPVGVPLAVVIEPGLADEQGNAWKVQKILPFGYEFSCGDAETVMPTTFPELSQHFLLAAVDAPLKTQLQLLGEFRVDPATGAMIAQFTNADRDTSIDCSQHGLDCDTETQACKTLPTPECVEPSRRAVTTDDYPDYTFNNTPPTGYSFTFQGCLRDQEDGSWLLANAPADVVVESPPVTVKGIKFNISFSPSTDGVMRGSGSFTAQQVLLGTTPSGTGVGTCTIRDLPPEDVPEGMPRAPEFEVEEPAP